MFKKLIFVILFLNSIAFAQDYTLYDCIASCTLTFSSDGTSVIASCNKDLSHVDLTFCDGTSYKFDNLNVGHSFTFSLGNKQISSALVKAGCTTITNSRECEEPTETPTSTPTNTLTFTPTSTFTNTPTNTNTPTSTFTFTNTNTPTNTPTRVFTSTNTSTPTSTPPEEVTSTPTNTSTNTPTFTPTSTLTFTNTSTPTFTRTFTSTPTKTFTNVPSNTPTNVFTNTFTPTSTNTSVPTSTSTRKPTETPTNVPTNTLVPTRTPTATPTCVGPCREEKTRQTKRGILNESRFLRDYVTKYSKGELYCNGNRKAAKNRIERAEKIHKNNLVLLREIENVLYICKNCENEKTYDKVLSQLKKNISRLWILQYDSQRGAQYACCVKRHSPQCGPGKKEHLGDEARDSANKKLDSLPNKSCVN